MLPTDIKELINENTVEWECFEMKEGYNPEDIIHSICAFANDINNFGGGHIAIGFKENSGKPVFPPVGLEPNQIDPYQKKLRELCNQLDPFYSPIVKPYVYENKMILVMWVPVGDRRPYKAPTSLGAKGQKRYYIRQASSTVIANSREEERLIEQSAKIKFESRINFDAPITSIDANLINSYLKETNSDLYPDSINIPLEELCNSILIAKGPKGSLRPLNVGLLLFTNNPHQYFPAAVIDVLIFQDEDGTEFIEKSFSGPVNKQIKDVLEFIKTNVIKEKIRKIADQVESLRIFNYPYLAIKEAIVNAVYHRSYEIDNRTEIRVFPTLIQIINFPGPIPPVNEQTILQDRIDVREYRNPILGKFLKDFKLSEERGTGIAKIRKEMKKNGSQAPEFDFGDISTHFMVILRIHSIWGDENYNLYHSKEEKGSAINGEILSNQEQIILELGIKGTTIDDLKRALNDELAKKDIIQIITSLKQKGYLSQTNMRRLFGIIKISLFRTTIKGQQVLRQSF